MSEELRYKGGFQNNTFHGSGEEIGSKHSFRGEYSNGNKASGVLVWLEDEEKFIY